MNIFLTCLLVILPLGTIHAQIDRDFAPKDAEIDQSFQGAVNERGAKSQRDALAAYSRIIDKARQLPASERIPILADVLFRLTRSGVMQIPERFAVYDRVQAELIAIPGHAKFFGDQIRELQKTRHPYADSYESTRQEIFYLYFTNMQSPETIVELGGFLSDEFGVDYEGGTDGPPKDYRYQAPCDLALNSLKKIELRTSLGKIRSGRPLTEHHLDLIAWQAWWKKVKAGQLAFSFEGKDVEYRFKPDGTWIVGQLGTTKPGDRATNSTGGPLRAVKRGNARTEQSPSSGADRPDGGQVAWIVAAMILLAAMVGFLWRSKLGKERGGNGKHP